VVILLEMCEYQLGQGEAKSEETLNRMRGRVYVYLKEKTWTSICMVHIKNPFEIHMCV